MHQHGGPRSRRAPFYPFLAAALLALGCSIAPASSVRADDATPVQVKHDESKYEILVSATRRSRDPIDVPNGAAIVSGADLRKRGVHTLAEALQDMVGVTTGEGSDNGMRLPNIGLWGLQEFDALLITVDGVPAGGPFNPSLAMIPVEDIERIEVVKGPQGSLYGVSAFAGMVQVFTRHDDEGRGRLSLGGGSFSSLNGEGVWSPPRMANGISTQFTAAGMHSDGWQERTGSEIERGGVRLEKSFGETRVNVNLSGVHDDQKWGSPLPFDSGDIVPGFKIDENYAVGDAHVEHYILSAISGLSAPLGSGRFENTFGTTRDHQAALRSFPGEVAGGDTLASEGIFLEPLETTYFDDARWLTDFKLGGDHSFVGGAAVTWGRTTAQGIGFDFEQLLSDRSNIPTLADIPVGDNRSFADERTFLGVYAHDEWSPQPRFTLSGGGRYDNADEKLSAFGQEVGGPPEVTTDSKSTGAWSGELAGLVRLLPITADEPDAINLYGNWKSSFKPAAPNLTEAENASILEPERTHSVEGGVKIRALERQVALNLSWFQMDFENMVVSNLDTLGNAELLNAGRERFKGQEIDVTLTPAAMPGFTFQAGYAHHDARFVQFTFVTEDGDFRDVSGKRLELAPEDIVNARLAYTHPKGYGAWVAARHQGERAFNRRNTFFAEAFTEFDAGVNCQIGHALITVTGRNLGDDRHVVSESEIGDAQFYVAPPARVSAQVSYTF